jgi:hypothetical protein
MAPPSLLSLEHHCTTNIKVLFCETTGDINYMLSKSDVKELKREDAYTPILTAECREFVFHLTNSARVKSGVKLTEPRNQQYLHYYARMSDSAYEELVSQGRCGTRYGNSSKLNIIINEEL